jgi:amino acid transporter
MRDPRRDIPVAIARAGIGQALMYAAPILAVLVVLPTEQVTSLHGLIDAMKTVFTVYGGSVAADGSATLTGAGQLLGWLSALVFIWVLLASGSAWIMGAGRAQAAACMDGAGPRVLGRISARTGVPVVMGLVSGAVSLATMAVDLHVTGGDGQKYFSAALTVSIALIVLAYLLIYPAFIALRLHRPDLERPFLVPGGAAVAWLITALATGWSLLATTCLLWPGVGMADPDAALPAGFEGERLQFEMLVLTPIAFVLLACTAYQVATPIASRLRQRA